MDCPKCLDAGKIPLKTYKHGFTNCDCRDLPPSHYTPFNPDSIDFPCSRDFRRFYELEGGRADPGDTLSISPPAPAEQHIYHHHSDLSKQQYDVLQQTARKLEHVAKTLEEHLGKRKTTPKGGVIV